MIPTPHIQVEDASKIAKTVIMPGDPLRAEYIAKNYLTDAVLINNIRNMLAYTGDYKGTKVTVFPSGMGMPSMGIYSYELYKFYGVEKIIRTGTAGAYSDKLELYDTVLALGAWTESNFAAVQKPSAPADFLPSTDILNSLLKTSANNLGIKLKEGTIHTTDVFYRENPEIYQEIYKTHNCICVEMEAFALFHHAILTGKEAACILTISDSLATGSKTTANERQNAFNSMIQIALNSVVA